ncbi:pseudaminic acid CMP-transferase [Leptospira inadai serovar Lyme str. 10]|uniref:Pseudaminic acid CMP-transferase n=2 Tax=Leptospira inadai serovar Lyme TaxID=293084 RepID=V6HC59_9LEPT|nr:pseudaminic acid cytidylyltransferase [Leptospira inadai]EQA36353.1 pseudaminic acid CMP-transferase [Leptospira inadai serovar Lyme str. 10]PNV76500.1 pseudaminic acid cytidylyltransferase [Leptospira inadai serovar Lyme]
MANVAIITARGGSKRIPKKNIKEFHGRPIISYPIEAAKKSGLFEDVIVSTDDEEIADVSKKFGASIPFSRSAKNSDDYAGTTDVLLEVLSHPKIAERRFRYACCIYPTASMLDTEQLTKAWSLLNSGDLDTVFPIVKYGYPIQRSLRMDSNSLITMNFPENLNKRSQDLTPSYHDAGQFYFFNVERFLSSQKLWTERSAGLLLKEMEVQDIDTIEDWEIAEFKYGLKKRFG